MNMIEYLVANRDNLVRRWSYNNNIPDYMTADDVLQDLVEKFLINDTEFDTEEECGRYAQTCAKNLIMDKKRQETGRDQRVVKVEEESDTATWDVQRRSGVYRSFKYIDYHWTPSNGADSDSFDSNFRVAQDEEKATRPDKRELTAGFPFGQVVVMGDRPDAQEDVVREKQTVEMAVKFLGELDDEPRFILSALFGMVVHDEESVEYGKCYMAIELAAMLGYDTRTIRRKKSEALKILREKLNEAGYGRS